MTDTPAIAEWRAPPEWRAIDFLSDLHLSSATPRTFEKLIAHLRSTPANAVVMLGDVFEAWIGDDLRLQGFEAEVTSAIASAAARVQLAFMAGNRDFLIGGDWLRDAGSVQRLADPTLLRAFGQQVLLTHGDALCVDDVNYQQFRRLVRNPAWQQDFLRKPLDERRKIAAGARMESQARQAAVGPDNWADVDPPTASQWLATSGTSLMLHGHTHRPGRYALPEQRERIVLSDWDFDHATPPRGDVWRLDANGFSRIDLAA